MNYLGLTSLKNKNTDTVMMYVLYYSTALNFGSNSATVTSSVQGSLE